MNYFQKQHSKDQISFNFLEIEKSLKFGILTSGYWRKWGKNVHIHHARAENHDSIC